MDCFSPIYQTRQIAFDGPITLGFGEKLFNGPGLSHSFVDFNAMVRSEPFNFRGLTGHSHPGKHGLQGRRPLAIGRLRQQRLLDDEALPGGAQLGMVDQGVGIADTGQQMEQTTVASIMAAMITMKLHHHMADFHGMTFSAETSRRSRSRR